MILRIYRADLFTCCDTSLKCFAIPIVFDYDIHQTVDFTKEFIQKLRNLIDDVSKIRQKLFKMKCCIEFKKKTNIYINNMWIIQLTKKKCCSISGLICFSLDNVRKQPTIHLLWTHFICVLIIQIMLGE